MKFKALILITLASTLNTSADCALFNQNFIPYDCEGYSRSFVDKEYGSEMRGGSGVSLLISSKRFDRIKKRADRRNEKCRSNFLNLLSSIAQEKGFKIVNQIKDADFVLSKTDLESNDKYYVDLKIVGLGKFESFSKQKTYKDPIFSYKKILKDFIPECKNAEVLSAK